MGNLLASITNDDDEDVSSTYGDSDDSIDGSFPFSNIDLASTRKYDCILVFNEGSKTKQWKYSQYSTMKYSYLNLLDADDIEDRKNRFPHHGADWAMNGSSNITIADFNQNERKLVIKALKKLNIKCKAIKSLNNENLNENIENELRYYYIGISEERAKNWAHSIGYSLELEPDGVLKYLCLHNENLAKATINNDDISKQAVKYDFWKNVYVKYDINVPSEIYKQYNGMYAYDSPSLFTTRDRITLINDAITQDIEIGGAGIYIPKLQEMNNLGNGNHCIVDFFPLHTIEHLQIILNKLFTLKNICKFTKILNLPIQEFRSYFGEYFAIYFAFLQFITYYFIPLVIIGIIFGTLQLIYNQIIIPYIWILALIVMIWAILLPIFWKKKEMKYALKWGTLRLIDAYNNNNERSRPEFIGEYRTSIIDGSEEEFFDPSIRVARQFIACSIVLTFFIALIGSIAGIILLRIYVNSTQQLEYGSYIIAAANTMVIMFFNNIYGIIAEKLNKWENYKTEMEYENNLIIKIFIFRFINSYASLY
eukprot:388484_1